MKSLIFFTIYGFFLVQIKKLNNYLPIIRNINCISNNKINNIIIYFYIIKLLQFICPYFVQYIDFYIEKVKIDYYINNNYSVIFNKKMKISNFVNILNKFINEGIENKNYEKFCCNLISVKINNEEIKLLFFKNIIDRFRGLDSNFHSFSNHISNNIVDIFEFYGYKNIRTIEINKIPNNIKKYNNVNNICIYDII